MATMVKSIALEGIEGFLVEIEAATIRGQQQMISVIGLGDQAVKESGERMQAAMNCCGYDLPKDKTLISLAPGSRRKRGSHYDLGMTLALLAETDQISAKDIDKYVFIGELSLDGRIRPCTGVLSMITAARQCGIRMACVPAANLLEAQKIGGIKVYGLHTLNDAVRLLEGRGIEAGVSEQAEEKPDEILFERMPRVAYGLHRVVEARHLLGGLAVHGVLLADCAAGVRADHVAEERHVPAQVLEGEFREGAVVGEVVEADTGEITHHDCAGCLRRVGQRAHIIHRLLKGCVEVLAARLHLDEDLALPEAVDVALRAVRELDAVLKRGDGDGIHAEHGEELLEEALRLALLVVCVLPAFRERRRRLSYFVP